MFFQCPTVKVEIFSPENTKEDLGRDNCHLLVKKSFMISARQKRAVR